MSESVTDKHSQWSDSGPIKNLTHWALDTDRGIRYRYKYIWKLYINENATKQECSSPLVEQTILETIDAAPEWTQSESSGADRLEVELYILHQP